MNDDNADRIREEASVWRKTLPRIVTRASEKPTCSCSFCTNDMTLANHMWPMMRNGYLTPPPVNVNVSRVIELPRAEVWGGTGAR